jgi:fructose/tagatose bisphosphate aldolase
MIRGNVREARELMERARESRFAVGAFKVDNQETLLAIARAARVKDAPVSCP